MPLPSPLAKFSFIRSLFSLTNLCVCVCAPQVEEGCGLTTAGDIAAAMHHVLCFIHAEPEAKAASQQLLAPEQ